MKSFWGKTGWALLGLVVLAGAVWGGFAVGRNVTPEAAEQASLPAIDPAETDPEVFGEYYPRHLDSYQRNYDMLKEPSQYGGSLERDSHLDRYPYLRTLWAGYAFAREYNEDRGHVYTVADVSTIQRINEKSPATCWTCKSAEVPALIAQYGDAYYKIPFREMEPEIQHAISCSDCHDPATMSLRLTRPSLVAGLKALGQDPGHATRQEMRTLVCAQCHVEYYFAPGTGVLTFPWDNGTEPEQIYAYYQELGFKDWDHQTAGTPALKAQHPEFEMFQGSTHEAQGVACADCHMPYMKEGNTKISSHWWTSPLRHMEQSCAVCHRGSLDILKDRVFYTQDRVQDALNRAGNALAEAIAAIEQAAGAPGADTARVEAARSLHREAQWYWDYVAAENSSGFHNSQKALGTLAKAIDLAHQARAAADGARLGPAG